MFAEQGYHEASIVKITERAGIGLGTFYLYFDSKQAIFEALVIDLNRRVRHSMSEAMAGASSRLEAERAGFAGFFRFTAEHPALYRVVREAEFVSPEVLRLHYTRIVEGYEAGLRAAQAAATSTARSIPETTAWALMGMGELIGMRFLLWERDADGHAAGGARPAGVRRHDAVHRQRAGAARAADAGRGRLDDTTHGSRGQARARHGRSERHRAGLRAGVRRARRARRDRRPERGCPTESPPTEVGGEPGRSTSPTPRRSTT